ncbi:MAG: hypothetical protein AAFN41_09615, partial [Planctomycetota bacterium]
MKTEAANSIANATPAAAVGAWPEGRPVAAVLAGDATGRSRFSLVAEPTETVRLASLAELDRVLGRSSKRSPVPFGPGWVVSVAYHAGFESEPTAADASCIHDPAVTLARVEHGWIHDNRTGTRTPFGDPPIAELLETSANYELGPIDGLDRQHAYESAVAQAVELIHAGDVFQVNLTHALSASFEGSPRGLFADLAGRLAPWHGCYLEWDNHS